VLSQFQSLLNDLRRFAVEQKRNLAFSKPLKVIKSLNYLLDKLSSLINSLSIVKSGGEQSIDEILGKFTIGLRNIDLRH
jgi:hypothetical protein